MPGVKLIADCGATKGEWCLVNKGKKKTIITQGISPYFLSTEQITDLLQKELKSKLKNVEVDEVYYYGTGCANPTNVKSVKKAINKVFTGAKVEEVLPSSHNVECERLFSTISMALLIMS